MSASVVTLFIFCSDFVTEWKSWEDGETYNK